MDDLREFIAFKNSSCTLMGAKALQGKENGQFRLRIKLCLQGQLSQTQSELAEKPGISTSPPTPPESFNQDSADSETKRETNLQNPEVLDTGKIHLRDSGDVVSVQIPAERQKEGNNSGYFTAQC